ncbi:MAG TPA: FkbM family methyltransferase [Marmoricola sp.]
MKLLHRVRHAFRRVVQTRRAFDNPGSVLATTVLGGLGRRTLDITFDVRGGKVVAPARRGALFPVYEVFAEDVYRLARLTEGLPPDARVLDVGAHVGSFTVALAQALPKAHIWAYEASPTTAEYLHASVRASGLGDRVDVRPEALAAAGGEIVLHDAGVASPLSSTTKHSGATTVTVPCVTIADAFVRCGGSPDLVKIDAEGVEYDLLLLSEPGLWTGVRRIVLEYHEVEGHTPDQVVQRFSGLGLHLVAHEPMIGNPREGMMWFSRDGAGEGRR